MKITKIILVFFGVMVVVLGIVIISKKVNINPIRKVGDGLDSLNNVIVYYNGGVDMVESRNVTKDGYNIGLKYQCVEFVKRYYLEYLNHEMPDTYGHAIDFYETHLDDGALNKTRNLYQYTNPSSSMPRVNDIIVFAKTIFNKYGHVAIISKVNDNEIEIIQQNPGPFGSSREKYELIQIGSQCKINNAKVLGWLRKK